jgi:glutathione peroxidase
MTSTYDFTATGPDGSKVPLRDYAGKVLLIVNVASKCGLTPQYEGLESLYRADKDRGLEILGFPCNQFKGQEPGSPAYGDFYQVISRIRPEADGTDEVKWNFTKFLVSRDGTVVKRYEPPVPPADIKADLESYL